MQKKTPLLLSILLTTLILNTVNAQAQTGKVIKTLAKQAKTGNTAQHALALHDIERAAYTASMQLQHTSFNAALLQTTDIRVPLSNGKDPSTKRHSIVPSALTILGSPAIIRPEEISIFLMRYQKDEMEKPEYLPALERQRWASDRDKLRLLWMHAAPSSPEQLPHFLAHQVPLETMDFIVKSYEKLVQDIQAEHDALMPKIIYSSLPNEGRPFTLQEIRQINKGIQTMRSRIALALKSLPKDPYLRLQQKYWLAMFATFNPTLKGVLVTPSTSYRQDNRRFLFHEFALHNPDTSTPYLKDSKSMIDRDYDDEEEDDDSYAAVRAKQLNPPITLHQAELEREELLPFIPENLNIAIINDDLLPLINFRSWCKKGYLGKNATLAEFRDGFAFMQSVRSGVKYDLVITDLIVPNGGAAMMEDLRAIDRHVIVIASSKFYPGDGDDFSADDLFKLGMDGYMWYNSNLNEGSYGYIQYLRQMKNYFTYKQQHSWSR